MYVLEEELLNGRDSDLNEEKDIRMYDTRYEHCRGISEDFEDKSKIHALRWDVYTRKKGGLIKRKFLL